MNNVSLANRNNNFDVFKYNKYMATYPFSDIGAFKQWLEVNNLTHEEFVLWFNKDNQQPTYEANIWMDYLLNEYTPNQNVVGKYKNKFGVLIDFLIEKAKVELTAKTAKIKNNFLGQINPNTFERLLEKELTYSLTMMVTPTLTLELNVARVSKTLNGDTPEERFKHYIKLLSEKDYALQIFNEYPVLFDFLVTKTENYISEYLEFYSRLVRDYSELNKTFGNLGSFTNHIGDMGDSHNNGRFVRVCEFKKRKIVYKPRSLQADCVFQKLLLDLNKSASGTFKTCHYIDKGRYGWSEFIQYKKCKTAKEYKAYFATMGQYIALLYVLNSSDFHFENVIANGEHPMLIDLESIIHSDTNDIELTDLNSVHTVLNSYILPQRVNVVNQSKSFDFSAIGFDENQKIMDIVNSTYSPSRDDLILEKAETNLSSDKKTHLLTNGFKVSIEEIKQLLSKGFESLYKFFQYNNKWLGSNDNYQLMLDLNYRCIIRPTNVYTAIIRNLIHPDNLRCKYERNLYITSKVWVLIKNEDNLRRVSSYEANCLANGDVPIFNFCPKSKDIICGNHATVRNYFKYKTSKKIQFTQNKISKEDFIAQSWLINASMFSQEDVTSTQNITLEDISPKGSSDIIEIMTGKLIDVSLGAKNGYKWMNWISNEGDWSMTFGKDYELLSGGLGSLLYLANYAHVSNNKNIVKKVVNSVSSLISTSKQSQFEVIGGYNGAGGLMYALSKIYQISNNISIQKFVEFLDMSVNKLIKKDEYYDVLSGSAGCILSLIAAYGVFKNKKFIQTGHKCAEHLVKNFTLTTAGGGWYNHLSKSTLLGGFSHGVTGIGYSLAKFSAISNEKKYLHYVNQAFDYEDSLYDSSSNNYIDLREEKACHDDHSDYTGWCNGSLGIGLARLDLLKHNTLANRKKQFYREIPRFIDKIIVTGFNWNDSLCHGNAGSLEYLYQVSEYYPEYYSKSDFLKLLTILEKKVLSAGYRNGTYFNLFDPGLMVGSIGLAYQLLRFKNPQKVGNILLLN